MFDNNKKLCKSLGIKVLPFIEIVAGSNGKVESFSCGPSKISQLQVHTHVYIACPPAPHRTRASLGAVPARPVPWPQPCAVASALRHGPTPCAVRVDSQEKLETHGGCEEIPCTNIEPMLEDA